MLMYSSPLSREKDRVPVYFDLEEQKQFDLGKKAE